MTTRALLADALDLAHRLPRTWEIVRAGDCEPWVARKVAVISRALLADQVTLVDGAVSRAIAGHSPSTVLEIARAKVIEADPATHAPERERSRHQRYVSLSRADEFGYRCVISRVTAGDAAWVDAMVDRVADILADHLDADDRPLRLSRSLRSRAGVARVEGVGPVSVGQLAELLGHADVTVTPVLDLAMRRRADAYEHPEAVEDHVWAQSGGDVFPYSPRTATRAAVDFDHARPYVPPDRGGPPGQTGPPNSGPLRRRHHRWKTHAGYRCTVAGPGRHLWQTPLARPTSSTTPAPTASPRCRQS